MLGSGDATVLAAVVPVIIIQSVAIYQSRKLRQDSKSLAAEVRPNGGSSLRDAIDRMERMMDRLHERHDRLTERIYLIEDTVTYIRRKDME
jgi:hypothetical protein